MPRPFVELIALCSCALLFSGCETPPSLASDRPQASLGTGARPFSPTEESVIAAAIRSWHGEHAAEGMMYELDRYDRRIRRNLRNAVRDLCPPLPPAIDREDATLFTVSVDQADLPLGNYAYAVIRIGNRFDTQKFAYVYEYREEKWELLDQYLVTQGLMESALIDFSWKAYCEQKGIAMPASATDDA